METCDCQVSSACTETSTYCGDGTTTGQWFELNSVLTGALTLVGYFLFKFSQAVLPALIRWPIRIFCSLTGLTSLWSGIGHLMGTLRVIQNLLKWMSRIWRFTIGLFSKVSGVSGVIKAAAGPPSGNNPPDNDPQSPTAGSLSPSSVPREPGLRLILVGPSGGGRSSLADTLLGCWPPPPGGPAEPLMASAERRAVVKGMEMTVVDTPDLLGPSLGDSERAREALRSLQLASPGPHAILLVIQAPGSGDGAEQDAAEAARVALELFGEEANGHVITVLTRVDRLGPSCSLAQLLDADAGGLRTALSRCGQRAEMVDNGPDRPLVERRAAGRRLLERVMEMRALRGHFVHELQRREERAREELLADMAAALAWKLGHMEMGDKREGEGEMAGGS